MGNDAQRKRIDRAKPRSDPAVGRARIAVAVADTGNISWKSGRCGWPGGAPGLMQAALLELVDRHGRTTSGGRFAAVVVRWSSPAFGGMIAARDASMTVGRMISGTEENKWQWLPHLPPGLGENVDFVHGLH